MAVLDGVKVANENLLEVAKIGAMAALKAPKVAETEIKIEILTGEDVKPVVEILEVLGEASTFIHGDAVCSKKSFETNTPIVELLIGADTTKADLNWNCGACGFATCAEFNAYRSKNKSQGAYYGGPSCNWKVLDFGMAQAWAAAAIWQLNVENRAQTSFGVAALSLGHMKGCNVCVGISMGPCRDLVWYNRPDLANSFTMEQHTHFVNNTLPQFSLGFTGGGKPAFKNNTDWLKDPKYLKLTSDPAWIEKNQQLYKKMADIIQRENAKKQ